MEETPKLETPKLGVSTSVVYWVETPKLGVSTSVDYILYKSKYIH
jgi:hypothetical protein